MEKIDAIIAELQEHNGEMVPPWIVFNEDGGIDVTLFIDRIKSAVKTLEADRDNWRRQALDEDARANATHKDSLEVGNAAAMREALSDACYTMFNFLKTQYGSCYEEMAKALDKAKSVLSQPPRNCDVIDVMNADDEFEKAMGYTPSQTADERDELMRENWYLFKLWLFAEAKGENDGN